MAVCVKVIVVIVCVVCNVRSFPWRHPDSPVSAFRLVRVMRRAAFVPLVLLWEDGDGWIALTGWWFFKGKHFPGYFKIKRDFISISEKKWVILHAENLKPGAMPPRRCPPMARDSISVQTNATLKNVAACLLGDLWTLENNYIEYGKLPEGITDDDIDDLFN